ncbi:dephospho-CoA kinase [Pseudomonadota bacterium]
MYVLGLTGSIAMGKTWGAKCFRHFGVPVHDADACVHDLLAPGGAAVDGVLAAFPDVADGQGDGQGDGLGGVDRIKLSNIVFDGGEDLHNLEALLHPMVRARQHAFLAAQSRAGTRLVVLDIPLLYETGSSALVDATVVVSAPAFIQHRRVMKRAGMSEEKLGNILRRQTPDAIKRQMADYLVSTAGPRGQSLRAIGQIVKVTKALSGYSWGPHWGR